METWIKRQTVFSGPIFAVTTGEVRLDDGQVARRDVVEHPGGAAIVPVLDGAVLLVRQFRVAVGRALLEVPAGLREAGETPEQTARRELAEELGYRAQRLLSTGSYYTSPGFTNDRTAIYLAFDLLPTERHPDRDERLEIVHVPLADIDQLIATQAVQDAKTVIGLYALRATQH